MKAMILAAGLGTRLKPLTDHKPKALVEIAGKPMLEWVILKLIKTGIKEIIINVHHYPEQVLSFLEEKKNFGIDIAISDESDALLDSGGAILKASSFLNNDEAFLVHNVDVVTDLDISALAKYHAQKQALATLAVRQRQSSRYLLFDSTMRLKAWQNTSTGQHIGLKQTPEMPLKPLAFSGVYLISPKISPLITETACFPVIEMFLRLAPEYLIQGYCHDEGWWFDLGKEANMKEAALKLVSTHITED